MQRMSVRVKSLSAELVTHSHTALTHQLTGLDAVSCDSAFSLSSSLSASATDSQAHFFVA